jgi:hypothetical protein
MKQWRPGIASLMSENTIGLPDIDVIDEGPASLPLCMHSTSVAPHRLALTSGLHAESV